MKESKILYDYLDESKLFKGTVVPKDRSLMNVPFVTGDKDLDAKFVKEAKKSRIREPERTQKCRRYACKYLQCDADRRGRETGRIYESI